MDEEVQGGEAPKSKRPKESNFYQQKLKAWQPILTASNVFPYFYVIGIIFIPLGAFFLVTSNGVVEVSIAYTHCKEVTTGASCAEKVKEPAFFSVHSTCQCKEEFTLDEDMAGPVYAFYGLTNFFQNHRRYVMSRDDNQLNGQDITTPSLACAPYRYGTDDSGAKKIIAPCGTIANSMFNDTFGLRLVNKKGQNTIINADVVFNFENIAWKSDREVKFGKPPASSWNKTVKPPNWPRSAFNMSNNAYSGIPQLLVWMRTAALPNFRKNYGDVTHAGEFVNGLPAGKYQVTINYAYPVTQFGGTKRFILSQASWLGGKNPTLGIAYITVGCIHLVLAIIFTGIHLRMRHRRNNGL